MKKNLLVSAIIIFISINKGEVLGQPAFKCQCVDNVLNNCLNLDERVSTSDSLATENAFALCKELKLKNNSYVNIRRLSLCPTISTFVAYRDPKSDRPGYVIFYPKEHLISKTKELDWKSKGDFFHAISHIQLKHTGEHDVYNQELESDSIVAIWMKNLGATFEESILHLRDTKQTSNLKIPDYETRIAVFKSVYPSSPLLPPQAAFSYTCTNNCIAPCEITISCDESTNTTVNTRYFWNGIEGGNKITWQYEIPTSFPLTLSVLNPDGQESSFTRDITISMPKNGMQKRNYMRWGAHAGLNYSPDYNFLSPKLGLVFIIHPSFWGFQAELNYIRRVSETHDYYSRYNPFWNDYDYYSRFSSYKISSLELPLMLLLGRNREPKIGINALIGVSGSYGISGNVRQKEYTSLANGFKDYYSENYPIEFEYDDYQRTQIRGILGFSVGFRISNEYLYWGARVDAGMPNSQYFSPEINSYVMFKF